jgi:superfamily II DNA or RNA helicase
LHGLKVRKNSLAAAQLLGALSVYEPEPEVAPAWPDMSEIVPDYALFAHQRVAAAKVAAALSTGGRRVMLHMPTGSGKTRTAMSVVAQFLREREPRLAIWLATTEELCDQAAAEFARAWAKLGDRTVAVHRFWGAHEIDLEATTDGLVVGGLPKLYAAGRTSIPFLAKLADRAELVVVDEAHQSIAPTYSLVTEALLARRSDECALLGLTATPGRTWADRNADQKLADFFAGNKVTLEVPGYASPVDYLVQEGYLARPIFRELEHTSAEGLSPAERQQLADELDVPMSVHERLAADEIRSLKIIRTLQAMVQRHTRIIFFATTVGHALLIATVLRATGIAAQAVHGGTDPADRERYIRWYKEDARDVRVLCNYGVLTTGFDAPKTSAALIARPTRSLVLYSQMVGRAIRGTLAGGNKSAEIWTVVDTMLPGFGSLSEAFTNWEDVWN